MKRAILALATIAALTAGCDDDDIDFRQLIGRRIFAVDTDNNLLLFGSGSPGVISNSTPITGLLAGEQVVGIDFRPTVQPGAPVTAIGLLYGVTSANRLVTIDTATAAATLVGLLTNPLSGTFFGVDFNPTVDRIRVHSDTRQNLRLDPNVSPVTVIIDQLLTYIAGDPNAGTNPAVVANAYTFAAFGGITSLFAVDAAADVLALSPNPNGGTLQTITALPINTGGNAGFDIASNGAAFIALTADGASRSTLFAVNGLSSTSVTFSSAGQIRAVVRGLSIAP